MATNVISTKINLDIGNFKSKMNDAKKSIQDLQKSIKDSTGKDFDLFGDSKVGKKIEEIKTKAKNLGENIKNLPKPVQAIAGAVALGVALKKVYDLGKQRFFSGLEDINSTLQPAISTIQNLGSQIKTTFETLTGTQLNLGSFATIGVDYEDTMARVQGVTQTTGKEFEAIKNKAREMGAQTRYSATEAGEAMIEMGQQGWSASQIVSGVKDVLNLATVGNISLADSAELVTNTMNALGIQVDKDGKNVQQFADVVAQASVKSGTNVSQFAEAMVNVGSTAGALKIPLEDVATGIGIMGNNMIKGATAGTSMKTFLANMVNPTKQMSGCLEEYNLEGARQKILNGDLVGGYKDMAKNLENLTDAEKTQVAAVLAGKEGMAGLLAIIGKGEKPIRELEQAIKDSENVAQHMADTFDNTLKGKMMSISSAIQEKVLQAFDGLKPAILEGSDAILDFMRAWNEGNLEGGLGQLENKISEWSQSIPSTMTSVIDSIRNFISGGSLDSILRMGGDIVQGICNGIIQNKDNISQGISDLIGKVCDWINTNGPAIEEAGKAIINGLKNGISNNANNVNSAVDTVFGVVNSFLIAKQDLLQSTGAIVGSSFIKGMITGIAIEGVNTIGNGIYAVINTIGSFVGEIGNVGINLATSFVDSFMSFIFDCGLWDGVKQSVMEFDAWLQEHGMGGGTTKAQDAGFNYGKAEGDGRNKGLQESKTQTDATASQIGEGISQNIMNKLETMDASQLKALEDELRRLQSTTGEVASGIGANFGKIRESVRTNLMGVTNIGRNQFVNLTNIVRNQCVNQANIVRNQFTNIANIVRNQCQNARNNATRSFISMSKVIATQCNNARTSVVSKMMSINAVVNTQAWKARDNATRAFMSLAAVIRTQMANALSSVRSAMSQIAAATNRTLTTKVNISKTITTTNVAKSVQSKAQTFSLRAGSSLRSVNALATASYSAPLALASTSSGVSNKTSYNNNPSNNDKTNSKPAYFEIPLIVDGRQMAKASVKYMDGELKTIKNRNNRKKGV